MLILHIDASVAMKSNDIHYSDNALDEKLHDPRQWCQKWDVDFRHDYASSYY